MRSAPCDLLAIVIDYNSFSHSTPYITLLFWKMVMTNPSVAISEVSDLAEIISWAGVSFVNSDFVYFSCRLGCAMLDVAAMAVLF